MSGYREDHPGFHLPPSLAFTVLERLRFAAMYLAPPEDWKPEKFDPPEEYAAQIAETYRAVLKLWTEQTEGAELPQRNQTASEVYEDARAEGSWAWEASHWHELNSDVRDVIEAVVERLQNEEGDELVSTMQTAGREMMENDKLRDAMEKMKARVEELEAEVAQARDPDGPCVAN